MPAQFDISQLCEKSYAEQLAEYAENLPDGKAVELWEVLQELGIPLGNGRNSAKKAGIVFNAYLSGAAGGVRVMIANPRTIQKWNEAHQKLPSPKR